MKSPTQFKWSALVALTAIGMMGIVGACGKDSTKPVVPPPPPPPLPAPTGVTAAAVSASQIDVTWTDNATNEDGYKVESCSGAACANFAEIGAVAANVTAFSNTGLTAGTSYSFRVRAHNAQGASDFSNTATASTEILPPPQTGAVLVGAGEITSCATQASTQTAALIDGVIAQNPDAIVYTVGNNLADIITPSRSFESCFDPKWGAFKPRMRAAVGQMDFESVGETSVYNYFGDKAGAPDGWYSFDVGANWHVIVLNTATWQHGAANLTEGNSPQNTWLAADLAANTRPCIMVISWERRIYTNSLGGRGRQNNMLTIGNILYAAGVDLLVSAKDKLYARFPQTDAQGVRDDVGGFRQFLVGTGGRSVDQLVTPAATADDPISPVEVQSNSWGVLKFTLNDASYDWEFIPTVAGGFTDSGTTNCH